MINHSVVSKSTVPMRAIMPPNKWVELLDELDMDKALKFPLRDAKRANSVRSSVQGCLKKARKDRYRVRTMSIRNPDGTYTLYVWKEVTGDKCI